MSDSHRLGVVYTEHADLRVGSLLSVWSYESEARGPRRQAVARNRDGNYMYWLERSDPLLNTILPGTAVSVVVNFGEPWAAGRSLSTSALLPRCAVFGPVTRARILSLGPRVDAIGAVLSASETRDAFGATPSELVDRIVPLEALWGPDVVQPLFESLAALPLRRRLATLSHALIARTARAGAGQGLGHAASRLMTSRRGRVSIEDIANRYGVTRQCFARTFSSATGVTPKLFARITRFQAAVHALLSSDVSEWASVASDVGFYDQAHMINEFREFTGSPPREFFRPHGDGVDAPSVRLRGRPYEWQAGEPASASQTGPASP